MSYVYEAWAELQELDMHVHGIPANFERKSNHKNHST